MDKSRFSTGKELQDKDCKKAVESAYFTKLTDKKNELGYDMHYLLASY